jgi:hypothetical protein
VREEGCGAQYIYIEVLDLSPTINANEAKLAAGTYVWGRRAKP